MADHLAPGAIFSSQWFSLAGRESISQGLQGHGDIITAPHLLLKQQQQQLGFAKASCFCKAGLQSCCKFILLSPLANMFLGLPANPIFPGFP